MKIKYNGIEYKTQTSLAEAMNLSQSAVFNRLKLGLPLEYPVITQGWWNNYNGKFYPTLNALAEEHNVKAKVVSRHIHKGYTEETSLMTEQEFQDYIYNNPIFYLGKSYKGLKGISLELGKEFSETDQIYRNMKRKNHEKDQVEQLELIPEMPEVKEKLIEETFHKTILGSTEDHEREDPKVQETNQDPERNTLKGFLRYFYNTVIKDLFVK